MCVLVRGLGTASITLWALTASVYYSSMDCSCSFILAMFISRTSWISSHWIHRPISLKPYSTKTENAVDIRYRNTDILIKEIQTRKTEKSSEKAHFTHNHRQDNTFPRKMQVLLQHGDTIHELDSTLDNVSISSFLFYHKNIFDMMLIFSACSRWTWPSSRQSSGVPLESGQGTRSCTIWWVSFVVISPKDTPLTRHFQGNQLNNPKAKLQQLGITDGATVILTTCVMVRFFEVKTRFKLTDPF